MITDLPAIPFPNEGTDIRRELWDGARAWEASEKGWVDVLLDCFTFKRPNILT